MVNTACFRPYLLFRVLQDDLNGRFAVDILAAVSIENSVEDFIAVEGYNDSEHVVNLLA